jgi:hypothetical protein
MAATTESVKTDAAEAPLLNVRNMVLGFNKEPGGKMEL